MYTELQVTSNFSFLRGASHPQELIEQAALLGYDSIAITDTNTLAGIVRAHIAAKKNGIRLIVGCRLDLIDGPSLLAFPTNRKTYASLCTLLSTGNLRTEKGKCELYKADIFTYCHRMKLIAIPPQTLDRNFNFDPAFTEHVKQYRDEFAGDLYIAASRTYNGDDAKYLFRLYELSLSLNIPMVATNDVHYHTLERRQLQDIVTCVREKCTIYNAGYKLHPNAERYLKDKKEMRRLFHHYPVAITHTQHIAAACTFSLDELAYEFPDEIVSDGRTPQEQLTMLAWEGAHERFGEIVPEKIVTNINYELAFIQKNELCALLSRSLRRRARGAKTKYSLPGPWFCC